MMNSTIRALTFSLVVGSQLVACLGDVTGQSAQEIGAGCGTSDDCRPGLECEVEHGSGTCQEHGGSGRAGDGGTSSRGADDSTHDGGTSSRGADDSTHDAGISSHDADDSTHDADDSTHDGAGTLALGAACATNAECAAGLECEAEHGVSTCQAHGHGGRN